MKKISIVLSLLGFFTLLFETINGFSKTELLFVINYNNSSFVRDTLILKKRTVVDGHLSGLYNIEGYLKKTKIEKRMVGNINVLDRDGSGNFLVWYYKKNETDFVFFRKKNERSPSRIRISLWFNLLLIILFLPSLIYYIYLKKSHKN